MAGLLVLALLALITGLALRFDPLVYLFYALVGVFVANRLWMGRSLQALRGQRYLGTAIPRSGDGMSDSSAFLGDRLEVSLELRNNGLLPLAWATIEERLPHALRSVGSARWTFSLGPQERRVVRYQLHCARRGYYAIGPLVASGGTPWESERRARTLAPVAHLTVYPHIVPLDQLGLPSRLPLGTRRSANLLLPDPSRLVGVRAYTPGDRLRDVHWRATARLGELQVKKYEPSQPLQVALFLDLATDAYDFRTRERASELAIVVVASLASHVVNLRQAVGLITNGQDPLAGDTGQPADESDGAEPEALVTPAPSHDGPGLLPATERLTGRAQAPRPAPPRRVLATDPFAPTTLPEETLDEEASAFFDAPEIDVPPAAPIVSPIHDGMGHLASLLAILARIELRGSAQAAPGRVVTERPPLAFTRMVRRRAAGLPWGTTVILITATPADDLLPTMLQLRQSGFTPLAIFVQRPRLASDLDASTIRAAGFEAYDVHDEGMLAHLQVASAP